MPTIIIHDPATVTIDGHHAGSFLDVLANHCLDSAGKPVPGMASAIQTALLAHIDGIHATHAAAIKARDDQHAAAIAVKEQTLADAEKAHADAVAKLAADHKAEMHDLGTAHGLHIKRHEERHEQAKREILLREQMIEALGGRAAYHQTREQRKVRAAAELAKAQAALDAVHAEDAAPAPHP